MDLRAKPDLVALTVTPARPWQRTKPTKTRCLRELLPLLQNYTARHLLTDQSARPYTKQTEEAMTT